MHRCWILFWIIIASTGQVHGQRQDELWIAARDAYLTGDITRATMQFESYLGEFPNSAAAMYNLANCYLERGDLGRAILHYERALKLRPRDSDILHNLSIARSRRTDPVVEIREFFARRWLWAVSGVMTPAGWAILSLIFFWCCIGGLALKLRLGRWFIPGWATMVLFLCFLFTLLMGIQRNYNMRRTDRGIVMQDETVLTLAPDQASKRVAVVGAGEKVLILDSLETYLKVRLPNFEHGWVLMEAVERI